MKKNRIYDYLIKANFKGWDCSETLYIAHNFEEMKEKLELINDKGGEIVSIKRV